MKLILGSSSKYRRAVLEERGYEFEVLLPELDEKSIQSDDPYERPLILARAKMQSLLPKVNEPAVVIALDIVVICDGELYEKPKDEKEARNFLSKYSEGYPAETVCGLVVFNTKTGKRLEGKDFAKVFFHPMPDSVIEEFIRVGEPCSRAGGFGIQVPVMKPYIKEVQGEVESIIGMPIVLLEKFLKEVQE